MRKLIWEVHMKYETRELIKAICLLVCVIVMAGLGTHYIDGIY